MRYLAHPKQPFAILLTIEVPDAEAPAWVQRLHELGADEVIQVPKRPPIPRHVVDDLREAFAEIKATRNGGPPLMTVERTVCFAERG